MNSFYTEGEWSYDNVSEPTPSSFSDKILAMTSWEISKLTDRSKSSQAYREYCYRADQIVERCENLKSQRAKYMGPTWSTPGSFRPQMGPMLAP